MSQADLKYQIEQDQIQRLLDRISNSRYPLISYAQQNLDIDPFLRAYAPEPNLEMLSHADSSGYFNVVADQAGVVRWLPLIIQCGQEFFAPLSIQCVWHYLDQPQLMVKVAD
jgi:hypothetical protein